MKHAYLHILLVILLTMFGSKAFAYDIAVANDDGVTIYYNYINEETELEVTTQFPGTGGSGYGSLTSLTIPETVTYMGTSRKVTSIGYSTFHMCMDLTSITIPSSVTNIKRGAFQSCSGLTDVYCYAKNVPTTNSDTFYGTSISDVTLHVPAASVDAYKAVAPWKDFKEVVALTDQETGIDVVSGDCDTEVARYTMGGQRVYRHAKGMNIIRMSNGKTKKMVVK